MSEPKIVRVSAEIKQKIKIDAAKKNISIQEWVDIVCKKELKK